MSDMKQKTKVGMAFSGVFIDSGFSRALIQKQDRTELDYSTSLIFSFITSIVIYLVLFFCAPAIARFYKTPELVSVQRVFFLILVFNSLSVVQMAQLSVKVDFKTIAVINSCTTILGGAIGIFFAYKGYSYWSLVIQNVSKAVISAVLFWILGKWKPTTGFSFKSFKKLFGFGSKLMVSGLLAIGQAISAILYFVINAYMAGKLFDFGPLKQFLCTWKCLVSALVMGALVMFVDSVIVSDFWSLIIGILTGVVSYAAMILLLRDDVALSLLNKFISMLKRKVK